MSALEWVIWIIIGGLLGWFASAIAQKSRRGPLSADVIVGSMGAMLGGLIFYQALPNLPVANRWSMFVASIGAVILLDLYRIFTSLIHIPIIKP